jgi:hypothetical protein
MKFRVWAGKATLATEQGKNLETFEKLESWLSTQGDGQLEVWAGRWWAVSKEALPFLVREGKLSCSHPSFKGDKREGDFSGFFAFEAWRIASRISRTHNFMSGDLAKDVISRTKDQEQ